MTKLPPSTSDCHLVELLENSEVVWQGHFLHVCRDTVQLPNLNHAVREYIKHPGAVMVLALLSVGPGQLHVLLERQYRHSVARVMLEVPAGKLDIGETGLACAQRELREETGYRARHWARAGLIHPCIGYADEQIELWFARDLELGDRALDDGEFLDVFDVEPDQLQAWCLDGTITDAKTICAAMWLHHMQLGRIQLQWQTV